MKLIKVAKKSNVKKADKSYTGMIAEKRFGKHIRVEIRGYDDGSRKQVFSIYTDGILSGDEEQALETLKVLEQNVKDLKDAIAYAKTVK